MRQTILKTSLEPTASEMNERHNWSMSLQPYMLALWHVTIVTTRQQKRVIMTLRKMTGESEWPWWDEANQTVPAVRLFFLALNHCFGIGSSIHSSCGARQLRDPRKEQISVKDYKQQNTINTHHLLIYEVSRCNSHCSVSGTGGLG